MDFPSSDPPRPSPRRELQGPRPTPLKVRKDSYKIAKKPPAHPVPAAARPPQPPPPQQQPPHHRAPVIIYAVSPKIIHTSPADFMTLVQRLTGNVDPDPPLPSPSPCPSPSYAGGPISPAARFATIERATNSPTANRRGGAAAEFVDQFEIAGGSELDRAAPIPGILSPLPSSLPPISPTFFSPGLDASLLSFLHELNPAVPGSSHSRGFLDGGGGGGVGSFLASPTPNYFLSTPTIPSPGAPFWDIPNQFPDF